MPLIVQIHPFCSIVQDSHIGD